MKTIYHHPYAIHNACVAAKHITGKTVKLFDTRYDSWNHDVFFHQTDDEIQILTSGNDEVVFRIIHETCHYIATPKQYRNGNLLFDDLGAGEQPTSHHFENEGLAGMIQRYLILSTGLYDDVVPKFSEYLDYFADFGCRAHKAEDMEIAFQQVMLSEAETIEWFRNELQKIADFCRKEVENGALVLTA